MTGLSGHDMVSRSPEIEMRLGSDGSVRIRVGSGRWAAFSNHAISVLDVVSTPVRASEILQTLTERSSGRLEWLDLRATLYRMVEEGVLTTGTAETTQSTVSPRGFASARCHVAMLGDRIRTEAFIRAIQKAVRPDDVVVDLGSGTGILAIAAARAGAARVHAIEAGGMASMAEAAIRSNGLSDQVELMRGWSTQVEVVPRGTVLVTETVGNDPLSEGILELVDDAKRRLLMPGARIIPKSLRIFVTPYQLPERERERVHFTNRIAERWSSWYGVDLTSLGANVPDRPEVVQCDLRETRKWRQLGDTGQVLELNLEGEYSLNVENTTQVTIHTPGNLDAVGVHFELDLGFGIEISSAPDPPQEPSHWSIPVWSKANPTLVSKGDLISITYHRSGGDSRLDWSHDR